MRNAVLVILFVLFLFYCLDFQKSPDKISDMPEESFQEQDLRDFKISKAMVGETCRVWIPPTSTFKDRWEREKLLLRNKNLRMILDK